MAKITRRRVLPETVFSKKENYSLLIQPAAFVFMKYDYSSQQQRIYATIIEALQKAFREERNNMFLSGYPENRLLRENSWEDFKKDFSSNDVAYEKSMYSLPIKIMMKDFGVPAHSYDDLKRDFVNFGYSPVGLRILGSRGIEWIEYQCLCRMRIPTSSVRVNRVYALFTPQVAMEMFRAMHAGYVQFMKEVMLNSQCKYTPRIYLFLSAYPDKKTVFIPYEDLRLYLRLDVSYKEFKHFKSDILNAAQTELRKLYDKGLSNLYFTFEPSLKDNQVTGINFSVVRSDNIRDVEIPYYDDLQKKTLFNLLVKYCGCSDKSSRSIVDRIDGSIYQAASTKIMELHKKFDSQFYKVSDMEAYTLKTFENFFQNEVKNIV